MNDTYWIEAMIGLSTLILGGGLRWIGGRITKTWDSLGHKLDKQNAKLDEQTRNVQTLTGQVNRIEDRVLILWAERTGSTRVDRNDDRL